MADVSGILGAKETFSDLLLRYYSYVNELSGSWEGISEKHFLEIAEDFYNDAKAINNQFAPFADAIKYYSHLVTHKKNVEISRGNYNACVKANDTEQANYWAGRINHHQELVASTTAQIEGCLERVGGLIIEGGNGLTELHSANKVIQAAIDWALATAADDSHGYSQSTRWGNPNYDCSSFVISAYEAAGTGVKEAGAGYTGNMISGFTQSGFVWVPGTVDVNELQPGDVLLDVDQHTEMYIGNGQNVGAHSNYDGRDGDSGGNEVSVGKFYQGTWDGYLRYVGTDNK